MLKRVVLTTVFTLFALLLTPSLAFSKAATPSETSAILAPDKVHKKTAQEIVKQLEHDHYAGMRVDNALSSRLFVKYLDQLDPNRLFFLESDINAWKPFEHELDNQLRSGDPSTGFLIYNRFRERVTDRLEWVIRSIPEMVANFDFTKDETIKLDRSEEPWPKSLDDADALWTKQLKSRVLSMKLNDKSEEEIVELLTKRYTNQLKRNRQTTSEDVFAIYMNALGALYDPHTDYFSPRISENFQINMSLKLEGIGAVLQSEDEYTEVVRLVPKGPAYKQGDLKPADKITGVGQGIKGDITDVVGWRLDDVVDQIRGPKGSIVRLEVIPSESKDDTLREVIVIKRDEVKLEEQSAQSRIIEIERDGITHKVGVIDIPAFYLDFDAIRRRDPNYRSTTRDVRRLLEELKAEKVEGLIIDLRENGGGSLMEANQLTGLFIEAGPTVQIRQSNAEINREGKRRRTPYYEGPLVVMINRMSASASEIFAAAIQDYGRGLVVGTQSFGKGTVQSINTLGHGQLKITESKFYRISGESTQHRGVVPDIEFPPMYNKEKVGESSLDHALEWDRISPVRYRRYHDLAPVLPTLKARHEGRASSDPDFVYFQKSYEHNKAIFEKTEISLNEKTRKAEREKSQAYRLELENERRKKKGLPTIASLDDLDEEAEAERNKTFHERDADAFLVETASILVDSAPLYRANDTNIVDNNFLVKVQ